MKIGVTLRNMGPQATASTLDQCLHIAQTRGFSSAWIVDHIAIPPDDAEGSDGRYLDPLATLAWLAARSEHIQIGSSVLILPYRPPLPTAKSIATIQELSCGRLLLGTGAGWMQPEFTALGIPRSERGKRTDEMLAFLHECFASDEIVVNGQPMLFRPRPPRPQILVGGHGIHALRRAVRWGDAWMPMLRNPAALAEPYQELTTLAAEAHRETPKIVPLTGLSGLQQGDVSAVRDDLNRWRETGIEHLVCGMRYDDADTFQVAADTLAEAFQG